VALTELKSLRHLVFGQAKSNRVIILAVIAMAHNLKLEVIAEGVETVLQKDFLKRNNCNIAQAYLFRRPVPYDDFCDLLERQKTTKH
jgi:sensor c-di-GMP phosphodiesterase-like protein